MYKSLQITQEHFAALYDNTPCRYFIYNSAKLSDVRSFAASSNIEIMIINIDAFRKAMDENLRNKGTRIVFIHGKGEGVLRQAIMKELNYRYKGHDVQDASFREYGYGATQVTIR